MNDTPEDHAAILQRSAKGEAGRRQRKKPSSAGGLIALAIRSASRIWAARNLKAKLAASCCEPQKTKGQYRNVHAAMVPVIALWLMPRLAAHTSAIVPSITTIMRPT
jgi:hypothetical protein